jgi:hypothetical protein
VRATIRLSLRRRRPPVEPFPDGPATVAFPSSESKRFTVEATLNGQRWRIVHELGPAGEDFVEIPPGLMSVRWLLTPLGPAVPRLRVD